MGRSRSWVREADFDRVVVWNRTDGGTAQRLKGFKVLLLGEDHQPLWDDSPKQVPNPSSTLSPGGAIDLKFAAALADFGQPGFPASAVLSEKFGKKSGWAIAPQVGKPHELTLMLGRPMKLAEGTLTVRLIQVSEHRAAPARPFSHCHDLQSTRRRVGSHAKCDPIDRAS